MVCDNILDILRVFSEQGHSGSSAPYVINLFTKLAMFKPISPLTGEDSEWDEISDGIYQNNRASTVFKDHDRVYDINGKVFREKDGACFTSSESRVDVTFPYTPTTEYVDVE